MTRFNCDFSSRFRILKGGKISLVVSALLGSVIVASAAPTEGVVTSGNATISQNGNTTNINQSSSKASINWQNFNIASNETVNFNQPNTNSITLNRVIGNEKSVINGALNANGQVWILNSNGILFSKDAKINTSGLMASTAELSDKDFQDGNYNFKNSKSNSVVNLGTIDVSNNGYVVLASNEVRNSGTIKAIKGKVYLSGNSEYTINLNGNSIVNLIVTKGILDSMVENSGTIVANGGEIYLTTNAVNELLKGVVNNTGIIEANSLDDVTGKVEVFAHGGTATVSGTINAEKGFVETSGETLNITDTAKVKSKTWLLDPTNITVGMGEVYTSISGNPASTSAAGDITINSNVISDALSSGTDVLLEATNNITVNSSISKYSFDLDANTTLTMKAGGNIVVGNNAQFINSSTAKLNVVLWSDSDATNGGSITLNSASQIYTNGGHVWLGGGIQSNTAWNGLTVGSSYAQGNSNAGTTGIYLNGAYINTNNSVTHQGGDIKLYGKGSSQNGGTGVFLNDTTLVAGVTGSINLRGDGDYISPNNGMGVRLENSILAGGSGGLTLTGNASSGSNAGIWSYGLFFNRLASTLYATNGDVILNLSAPQSLSGNSNKYIADDVGGSTIGSETTNNLTINISGTSTADLELPNIIMQGAEGSVFTVNTSASSSLIQNVTQRTDSSLTIGSAGFVRNTNLIGKNSTNFTLTKANNDFSGKVSVNNAKAVTILDKDTLNVGDFVGTIDGIVNLKTTIGNINIGDGSSTVSIATNNDFISETLDGTINASKANISVNNGKNVTLKSSNGINISGYTAGSISTNGGTISLLNGTSSSRATNGIVINDSANMQKIDSGRTGVVDIKSFVNNASGNGIYIAGRSIDGGTITIQGDNSASTAMSLNSAINIDLGWYGAKIGENAQTITFNGVANGAAGIHIQGGTNSQIGGSHTGEYVNDSTPTGLFFYTQGYSSEIGSLSLGTNKPTIVLAENADVILSAPTATAKSYYYKNSTASLNDVDNTGFAIKNLDSFTSMFSPSNITPYLHLGNGVSDLVFSPNETFTWAHNLAFNSKGSFELDSLDIAGNLWMFTVGIDSNNRGNITQKNGTSINVGGDLVVKTDYTAALTSLTSVYNEIAGAVEYYGTALDLTNNRATILGDIRRDFDDTTQLATAVKLTSHGDVSQRNNTLVKISAAFIDATGYDVTLNNTPMAYNEIGSLELNAKNGSIVVDNTTVSDMELRNINITGNLSIENGNPDSVIFQSGDNLLITAPTSTVTLRAGKVILTGLENFVETVPNSGMYSYISKANEIYNLQLLSSSMNGVKAYVSTSKDINILTTNTSDLVVLSEKGINISGALSVDPSSLVILAANSDDGHNVTFSDAGSLTLGVNSEYAIYSNAPQASHATKLINNATPDTRLYETSRNRLMQPDGSTQPIMHSVTIAAMLGLPTADILDGKSLIYKVPGIINVNYSLESMNAIYNGSTHNLDNLWNPTTIFGNTYSNWVFGTDYNFTYAGNQVTGFTNAGNYNGISVDILKSGFTEASSGNINGSLVIAKANATIKANSDSKIYNGQTQNVTGFTASGLVNNETTSVLTGVTGATASGTNAGTYNTHLSGTDENYNLTFVDGSLNINIKPIVAQVSLKTSETTGVPVKLDGILSSELVSQGAKIVVLDASNKDVTELALQGKIQPGKYSVKAINNNTNYALNSNIVELTINPALDPITVVKTQVSVPVIPVTTAPVISVNVPTTQNTQISNNLSVKLGIIDSGNVNLVSQTTVGQANQVVTLSELKTSSQDNANEKKEVKLDEVRVSLSQNSIVQLVNGGVNLPSGVDQQFYVVSQDINTNNQNSDTKNEKNKGTN